MRISIDEVIYFQKWMRLVLLIFTFKKYADSVVEHSIQIVFNSVTIPLFALFVSLKEIDTCESIVLLWSVMTHNFIKLQSKLTRKSKYVSKFSNFLFVYLNRCTVLDNILWSFIEFLSCETNYIIQLDNGFHESITKRILHTSIQREIRVFACGYGMHKMFMSVN